MFVERSRIGAWVMAALLAVVGRAQEPAAEAVTATEADDAESAWSATVDLAVLTGYLWRGMLINDEPVFQPSLTLDYRGFSLNVWATYDFNDSDEAPAFTEVDYSASYSFEFGRFAASLGYSLYDYPNSYEEVEDEDGTLSRHAVDSTHQVFGYIEIPGLDVVPSVTVEYGFGREETLYASFGLLREQPIAETLTAEVSAGLGWGNRGCNRYQVEADRSALSDATFGVSLVWAPVDPLAVSASLAYSYFVSDSIADAAEACGYDAPDALAGGLTLSYAF